MSGGEPARRISPHRAALNWFAYLSHSLFGAGFENRCKRRSHTVSPCTGTTRGPYGPHGPIVARPDRALRSARTATHGSICNSNGLPATHSNDKGAHSHLIFHHRILLAARRLHWVSFAQTAVRTLWCEPRGSLEDFHELQASILVLSVWGVCNQIRGLLRRRCSTLPATRHQPSVPPSGPYCLCAPHNTRSMKASGGKANLLGEPAGLCGRIGVGDTSWGASRRRWAMVFGGRKASSSQKLARKAFVICKRCDANTARSNRQV